MKIIKIKSCQECPHLGSTGDHCNKKLSRRILATELPIPDWCPLEDTTCSDRTSQANTFCPNGGAGVAVDREGFCLSCGATAVGPAVDQLFNDLADQLPSELPSPNGGTEYNERINTEW